MQITFAGIGTVYGTSRQSAKLFLVVRIGTPPTPHPQASVSPPLVEGEVQTRLREWGLRSPNSYEETDTVVL
jgi:hypothetical protein